MEINLRCQESFYKPSHIPSWLNDNMMRYYNTNNNLMF